CKNTRKLLRNGQAAPPKMDPVPMPELQCETVDDHYILRDGAAGLFLAASQFPRNRETRAPLVSELLPHAAEIDPKYAYLMEAPIADDAGNPSIVRYSRKTAEIYVQSEIDKKASGWKAFYIGGEWKSEGSGKAGPKKAVKKAAKKTVKKTVKKAVKKTAKKAVKKVTKTSTK
ncbi:MAG: DNA topoisomerase I subunit omega, partial [Porticoccaceae bacterium]|nr:DNA topoisomerase I subunit omega [Porticoccaceae bacterium]